ncbi:type I CRISPR-associated protein Cas7 [Paenibacillus sp. MER TA 81-3]|uniref:CRISPR-associated protein n=1 Tax=Paenibacillus sp. MER TA 81-3 TaxID=2939573 RepID=UPI00203B0751|nr:CRISPR-associated protein [Paenibacillus sp. MER TA 81-3]MCM3341548.1 type I CRISPR-associated protein Cas7 [Paenibacillus sp. MER TA 81-3]
MQIQQNSDFLFMFEAVLTNPNGDPDQENKPRMDYETSTLLVSDARRKRDCRDMLKNKGYSIFVDTLAERKVPADKMFEAIRERWLSDPALMRHLFEENPEIRNVWAALAGEGTENYKEAFEKLKSDKKLKQGISDFNNLFITEAIKHSLIDVRMFGSAMAVENVSRTFTGPIQLTWGYSLHPVELVQSNTITSIMNDDNSTFGKKHKVHYAFVAHYGTINKFSAQLTGMTEEDRDIFRKSIIQGMMTNQTDSKQGQTPMCYLEIVYSPGFDGYLGDWRRFVQTKTSEEANERRPIRSLNDITVDFTELSHVIDDLKAKGYIDHVVGWLHPFVNARSLVGLPAYTPIDLWASVASLKGE